MGVLAVRRTDVLKVAKPQFAKTKMVKTDPTRILQFLRVDATWPEHEQFAALMRDEWQAFALAAIQYRVAAQVAAGLKSGTVALQVPEDCMAQLDQAVRSTLMRNMRQQLHLRAVLSACAEVHLPIMLLKGLWLAEVVYRDLKARPTGDIDLWVRPEDMSGFLTIARRLGYQALEADFELESLLTAHNEITLRHPGTGVHLDVHWGLTRPGLEVAIDESGFWQRALEYRVAAMPCLSLDIEDQLLFLCFHAAVHHRLLYVGPRALLDVALLIAAPPRPLDWSLIVRRAQSLGWERGVGLMCDLVMHYFAAPVPCEVLTACNGPVDEHQRAALREAALDAVFAGQSARPDISPRMLGFLNARSMRQRLRMLMRHVFPGRAVLIVRYLGDAPGAPRPENPGGVPGRLRLYRHHWQGIGRRFGRSLRGWTLRRRETRAEVARARLLDQWLSKPD